MHWFWKYNFWKNSLGLFRGRWGQEVIFEVTEAKFWISSSFCKFSFRIFVVLDFEVVWPRRPQRPRRSELVGFQTMLILDPFDMTFDAVGVFGLAFWLLFKSTSSYCDMTQKNQTPYVCPKCVLLRFIFLFFRGCTTWPQTYKERSNMKLSSP